MHGTALKATVVIAILALTSCGVTPSSETGKNAEAVETKSPVAQGPITGKTAFWEMYKSARAWSSDIVPLSLESKEIPGIKNADGKAAMWSASFGSPKLHQFRTFSYSIAASKPDIIQGIMIGNTKPWNGPVNDAMAVDPSDLMVDSDTAFQTALAQAAAWVRKNPGKDACFFLGKAWRFPALVLYVVCGDKKSGYAVYVNAKTGTVVKIK